MLPPVKGKPAAQLHWAAQHEVQLLLLWCGACALYTANAAYTLGHIELNVLWLYWQPTLPPLLMLCLWGTAVRKFSQLSVEYEQCFAARDRKYLLEGSEIQRVGLVLLAVATGSAAVYSAAAAQRWYLVAEFLPLILYMGLVAVALIPLAVLHRPTRQFFATTAVRVLLPLQEVSWADFLLADILCSLSKTSADMAAALCHSATGPVMQSLVHPRYQTSRLCQPGSPLMLVAPCIPYIIRFIQCIIVNRTTGNKAQLFNAAKYFTSFPALILTGLEHNAHMRGVLYPHRNMWLCIMLFNTLYSYYWDVEQDWDMPWLWAYARRSTAYKTQGGAHDGGGSSLQQQRLGWRGLLPSVRPDAAYNPRAWYTWALLTNLLLRFAWLHRLVGNLQNNRMVSLLLGCAEVWRRYQWSYIRIETELRKIAARSASAMSLAHVSSRQGMSPPPGPSPPLHTGPGHRHHHQASWEGQAPFISMSALPASHAEQKTHPTGIGSSGSDQVMLHTGSVLGQGIAAAGSYGLGRGHILLPSTVVAAPSALQGGGQVLHQPGLHQAAYQASGSRHSGVPAALQGSQLGTAKSYVLVDGVGASNSLLSNRELIQRQHPAWGL